MLFFLFLAISFLPSLHAMSCIQTVNGTTYNLTSIHGLGDIKITPQTGAYDYYINVCGAVQGPCISHPDAFMCQVRKSPPDQFESVVAYSNVDNRSPAPTWTQSTSTYGGVKLTFTNGDSCNLRQRILNIDFQCDINNTRSIEIYEMPLCTFNVIFPTNRTCIDAPSFSSSSSFTNSSSSSSSHSNSSTSSTGPTPSNSSSTAAASSTGPSNSSSAIPTNSSSAIPSNSSSAIPSNSSSAIPSNSSSAIPSNSSSTSIFSSSSIPSSESSWTPIPPMSSTGHIDSSTGTIPSKQEEGSTVTITGAGIGIGILIGTSVTSALVLIWCCWDRPRRRSTAALNINERQYTSLDA